MTDVTARYHRNNPESTAANPSPTSKAAIRQRVLDVITTLGPFGATSDEVEAITSMSHQTVSARMTELKAADAIRPAGRRKTRSGRTAAVYVAVPVQGELFGSGAA